MYEAGKGTEASINKSMIDIEGFIGAGDPIKVVIAFFTYKDITAVEASKVL